MQYDNYVVAKLAAEDKMRNGPMEHRWPEAFIHFNRNVKKFQVYSCEQVGPMMLLIEHVESV